MGIDSFLLIIAWYSTWGATSMIYPPHLHVLNLEELVEVERCLAEQAEGVLPPLSLWSKRVTATRATQMFL